MEALKKMSSLSKYIAVSAHNAIGTKDGPSDDEQWRDDGLHTLQSI